MATKVFRVCAEWDDEAKVWYVSESDVPGLATGASTIPELVSKLKVMVPELLVENGAWPSSDDDDDGEPEVPIELIAKQHEVVRRVN